MPAFIAHTLQFLYEKRTKTSPAKRLRRFHVDIAIGPVVMKENATTRCHLAFYFHDSMPPELIAGHILNFSGGRLAERRAERPVRGAHLVMEENGFAGHRSR